MNTKQKITLLLCLLFATTLVQAQVTIGSSQAPNKGSLLDLKTEPDGSHSA